jgi:hypothetical protein
MCTSIGFKELTITAGGASSCCALPRWARLACGIAAPCIGISVTK